MTRLHRLPPKPRALWSIAIAALFTTSCGGPSTPTPDLAATAVAQAAYEILAQTAAAASPTPPPPTDTTTPAPSETPAPSATSSEPPERPRTANFAACWLGGPGMPNSLDSNITKGKAVDLLGIGDSPGWYVIRNPYFHRPCWILESDLKIFPGTDLTALPVMTPGIPLMGQ